MSSDLRSLALKYITDKEITYGHDYIPGYTELFEERRHRVKNMLEIGIGLGCHYDMMVSKYPGYTKGGGLRMWQEYFPSAEIYGMDIHECPPLADGSRITTMVGNQASEADLMRVVKAMGGCLEIVIDDGIHRADYQVISFMVLAPYMAKEGIYVIEDVNPRTIDSFKSLSIFPEDFQDYIRENFYLRWYDTRGKDRPSDDFLMVFIKK